METTIAPNCLTKKSLRAKVVAKFHYYDKN